MCETCTLAVFSAMYSALAISRLVCPAATSARSAPSALCADVVRRMRARRASAWILGEQRRPEIGGDRRCLAHGDGSAVAICCGEVRLGLAPAGVGELVGLRVAADRVARDLAI